MEVRQQTVMNDTAQQDPESTQIRVRISGRLSDPKLSGWGESVARTESEPDRFPVLCFGTGAMVDDEARRERRGERRHAFGLGSAHRYGICGPSQRMKVSW